MNSVLERRINLEGSFNFRDLGGYRTTDGYEIRWRRLFRSDALHRLTEADLAVLQEMGLRTLIDLRTKQEIDNGGLGALHEVATTLHRHVPFAEQIDNSVPMSELRDMGKLYLDMLDRAPACLREVFTILADDNHYPAVVHCAAGKDRTGITVGIVLRALGVPDEEILADYALTDGYLAAHVEQQRSIGMGSMFDQVPPALLRAEPVTLRGAFNLIDERHGSIDGYLSSLGVTTDTLVSMKRNLLIAS